MTISHPLKSSGLVKDVTSDADVQLKRGNVQLKQVGQLSSREWGHNRTNRRDGGRSFHPKGSSRSSFDAVLHIYFAEMELTTCSGLGRCRIIPGVVVCPNVGAKTLSYFWQRLEKQRGRQRFHHGNQKQIDWHLGSGGNMKGATERRWGWELKCRRDLTAGNIKHV